MQQLQYFKIWTDGACFPNPGKGGWAWVDEEGNEGSGHEPVSTNNRMEIIAVIEAIKPFRRKPIEIITDSKFVIESSLSWRAGWEERGWMTKGKHKTPIKNRELWEELFSLIDLNFIKFTWVKGHSGDRMNELADKLATAASQADAELIARAMSQWHNPNRKKRVWGRAKNNSPGNASTR